jgi:hypothetical protein
MAIKLPKALKKIPPLAWVAIGGVVLAVLYIKLKGTGSSTAVPATGTTSAGSGGSGGTTTAGQTALGATDLATLLAQQQAQEQGFLSSILSQIGGGGATGATGAIGATGANGLDGLPGGTVSPGGGLPGVSYLGPPLAGPPAVSPTGLQSMPSLSVGTGGLPGSASTVAEFTGLQGQTPQQYLDTIRATAIAGASIPSLQAAVAAAQANYNKVSATNPLSGGTGQVQANMGARTALDAAKSALLQALQNQAWAGSGAAVGSTQGATLAQMGVVDASQVANPVGALLNGLNISNLPTVGVSTGTVASDAANAARASALQGYIATLTRDVSVNKTAGNTASAAVDAASLAKYQAQLAALIPTLPATTPITH